MTGSEKNMYSFYRTLSGATDITLFEGKGYAAVSGSPGCWPQMVFDLYQDTGLVDRLNEILTTEGKRTGISMAVCNRGAYLSASQEQFRKYGIYPVEFWPMMELNASGVPDIPGDGIYEVRHLKENSDLEAFTKVVNDDLLRRQIISAGLFPELAVMTGINFYGVFYRNKMAGGLLTYSDNNGVAGLYFIVIGQEFRGQGLASILIRSVVKALIRQQIEKVVLQALPKAVTLYQKLGFIKKGELIIFRKM